MDAARFDFCRCLSPSRDDAPMVPDGRPITWPSSGHAQEKSDGYTGGRGVLSRGYDPDPREHSSSYRRHLVNDHERRYLKKKKTI